MATNINDNLNNAPAGVTKGATRVPANSAVFSELEKGSLKLSVIKLVDAMMSEAYKMRASDVHIDPAEDKIKIRLRIDGVMNDIYIFPKEIHSEVITRIKVIAGLRTDEHQMAQDGRFKFKLPDKEEFFDLRVSIAPTYHGENCVMRILAEQAQELSLEAIGYSEGDLKKVMKAMTKPYGMILATGPTSSGKTTSLYAILKKLNTKEVSIITIEDPVEYSLEGVDQIQVNDRTGLTFAHGLRFILRQDPNIIMVGEIRDEETAGIAVNAAMTGHKLLSTLHANDAATTLPRLIDMKIEPFLITSTINIIIGQRLVRLICSHCKASKKLSADEIENLKQIIRPELLSTSHTFYEGQGCPECNHTGFKGRTGIHEVLEMSDVIRDLVMRHANAAEIKNAAVYAGMTTMLEDGFNKAILGITTIEEVLRVFRE
ncbi:MAG: GspE/PulE family protein [bacterium]|nr:GspE/PulE family protein [bacterium]